MHSPAQLQGELLRADSNIVVLMCKAQSCRPCKVKTLQQDSCIGIMLFLKSVLAAILFLMLCTVFLKLRDLFVQGSDTLDSQHIYLDAGIAIPVLINALLERCVAQFCLRAVQMFARKYQRIAADYASKGAIFLEILGDETSETRVGCFVLLHAASRSLKGEGDAIALVLICAPVCNITSTHWVMAMSYIAGLTKPHAVSSRHTAASQREVVTHVLD